MVWSLDLQNIYETRFSPMTEHSHLLLVFWPIKSVFINHYPLQNFSMVESSTNNVQKHIYSEGNLTAYPFSKQLLCSGRDDELPTHNILLGSQYLTWNPFCRALLQSKHKAGRLKLRIALFSCWLYLLYIQIPHVQIATIERLAFIYGIAFKTLSKFS